MRSVMRKRIFHLRILHLNPSPGCCSRYHLKSAGDLFILMIKTSMRYLKQEDKQVDRCRDFVTF